MSNRATSGEKFERGLATRKAVLAEDYAEKSLTNAGDFGWPLQQNDHRVLLEQGLEPPRA